MGLTITLSGNLEDIALDVFGLSQLLNPGTASPDAPVPLASPVAVAAAAPVPVPVAPLAAVPDIVPEPAAAAEPVAAAGPVAVAVDLDSLALPWDERICASNKAKNKDGTWRARRNTAKDLIAAVHAEQRAAGYGVVAAAVVAAPVTDPTVAASMAAAGAADLATATGGAALADTIALATQIVTNSDSPDVWGRINSVMEANQLPQGVQSLTQFPDKVPAVHMALQLLAKELGVG